MVEYGNKTIKIVILSAIPAYIFPVCRLVFVQYSIIRVKRRQMDNNVPFAVHTDIEHGTM
jgi:hypothetical protein